MNQISYQHRPSKRAKNLTIKINAKGEVIVVTPPRVSQRLINKFIKEKKPWIVATLKKIELRQRPVNNTNEILIFGQKYNKKILNTNQYPLGIYIQHNHLVINLLSNAEATENQQAKTRLNRFLKNTAEKYIVPRSYQLSKQMALNFKKITLREQKTRWGSCSSRGNMNLNWRLVHQPIILIDYVIIHELAHLEHMNHSANFWGLVADHDPNFKAHRKLLRKYQYLIN